MAWDETDMADWLAWLDTRRTMSGWCIAYRYDGRVCRALAAVSAPEATVAKS